MKPNVQQMPLAFCSCFLLVLSQDVEAEEGESRESVMFNSQRVTVDKKGTRERRTYPACSTYAPHLILGT